MTPVIIESGDKLIDKRIGDFAKTLPFIKLIYKFLQVAIDTANETYLPHLLHLIHAIVLDDEKIHGKEYLNENFVVIPITDLLLTIVESKMSNYVCEKPIIWLINSLVKTKELLTAWSIVLVRNICRHIKRERPIYLSLKQRERKDKLRKERTKY